MSSTAARIIFISQQCTIYVTVVLLITGVIGNCLNLLIFTTSKTFHGNQCVFLLSVETIVDIVQIAITLSSRIITDAIGVDPIQKSVVWCKIRSFLAHIFSLISMSTICFIAFDQFLSTSYLFYLKNISTFKLTRRFLSISICFSVLHGIPLLIFMEIHSSKGCNIYNSIYFSYYMYFYFVGLIGLIPITISGIFSLLAFYNVRHIIRRQVPIARRRFDHQLTIMSLLRVICLIVLVLPYIVYRIYSLTQPIIQSNPIKLAVISLVGTFANSLIVLNYAGSFYLFLVCSARFRRQAKHLFIRIYAKLSFSKIFSRPHRIAPAITVTPAVFTVNQLL